MWINQAIPESAKAMTETPDPNLAQLGWRSFFSEQISAQESRECQAVRVMSVHRGRVTVLGEGYEGSIPSSVPGKTGPEDRPTVGDWLLISRDDQSVVRILDRTSLFKRPAPGDERRVQLIAANVDTLFIVTSCNHDFNVARIERYLVLSKRPAFVLWSSSQRPTCRRNLSVSSMRRARFSRSCSWIW
jgi:ribosome biogenesis GTPase